MLLPFPDKRQTANFPSTGILEVLYVQKKLNMLVEKAQGTVNFCDIVQILQNISFC